MDPQQSETIDAVVRILRSSRSMLFVTGAGISADSGIPTYRGIGGLYDVEVTEEGFPIEINPDETLLTNDVNYVLRWAPRQRWMRFGGDSSRPRVNQPTKC